MTTSDRLTLADLEDRVRNGDTTVTAEDLAKAREADHLESLRREAAVRAHTAAQQQAHEAALAQLWADFEEFSTAGSEPARRAYAKAVSALAELRAETNVLNKKRAELLSRSNELGVDLPFALERVFNRSPQWFVDMAVREAQGEPYGGRTSPHALHSDKQVAEFHKQQEETA